MAEEEDEKFDFTGEGEMIQVGNRVRHQSSRESLGEGTVLEVDELNNNGLVEWDTHRVQRETRDLPQTQSRVKLSSLVRLLR